MNIDLATQCLDHLDAALDMFILDGRIRRAEDALKTYRELYNYVRDNGTLPEDIKTPKYYENWLQDR